MVMEKVGKRFAGVAGKTVKFIDSYLDEDEQPHISIDFTDGENLDIRIKATPEMTVEWAKDENGTLEYLPDRKVFE